MSKTIVVIPARLHSKRLPGKIMADIGGQPMLFHVTERAIAANVGPVVVACDDFDVCDKLKAMGLNAIMTATTHVNGTERIGEALSLTDPNGYFHHIVNVQADIPFIDPQHIRKAAEMLQKTPCDIVTLCALDDFAAMESPHVVKVIGTPMEQDTLRALYFTRAMGPWGDGPLYHHIGLYAYHRAALNRLRYLPMTTLERRESLEQLRPLEHGLEIHVGIVDRVPISVDTQDDLDRARRLMERMKNESQDVRDQNQGNAPT